MKKTLPVPPSPPAWLEEAYPQMHHLLLSLEGDAASKRWIIDNSPGLDVFVKALEGSSQAAGVLDAGGADLDDLFEVMDNDDLAVRLREAHPELYTLCRAVRGDEEAARALGKAKSKASKLVPGLRRLHDAYLERQDHPEEFGGNTASDMGCLIGEMHLKQGEYERAVEAFSRAIESRPSADLYQGRARAYRMMAEADEAAAGLLRK